jgi:hypothetical protein
MPESNVKSILAADCGTVTTTAILIEQVKGEFRLVASGETFSTYASPWRDITLGVAEAISQIEKKTDRTLLAPGAGWPLTPQSSHQQGVDAFIAVSSAGAPLRMVLAGLMQDITLTSARRAAATTYASVVGILSLDTVPNTGSHKPSPNLRHRAERRIQAIQAWQPEVILLTGGTDGGAERPVIEMANILSMAMRVLAKADKPAILFAGNSELRAQIAEILGPVAEFKSVDNIRPSLDSENLAAVQTELGNLYTQRKIFQLSGFQKLRNWSKHPVTPTGKSFEKLVAYIGRHNNLNVIGVNIGSGSTIVSTHVNRRHNSTIRSDAGVGHNLHLLLNSVTLEKFHRWLPISVTLQDLHNRLLNKSLRPGSIPTTFEELMIEHAVAREALRLAVEQARDGLSFQSSSNKHAISWGLIIGAGRTLTRTPHPGYAAMIMLDGIEPWGVTSLALDVSGTLFNLWPP